MNFEHPQKAGNTPGTNVGAATSPIALSERSTAAAARLLTLVTSAELPTPTRGPPSARHLADGAPLLRGLRAIPWLEGRVTRLFTLLAAEVNNRFGLHATV